MHFSFWYHEILTHLCNVLLTHADVSVLTGQKGRGKGRGGGCGWSVVPELGCEGLMSLCPSPSPHGLFTAELKCETFRQT